MHTPSNSASPAPVRRQLPHWDYAPHVPGNLLAPKLTAPRTITLVLRPQLPIPPVRHPAAPHLTHPAYELSHSASREDIASIRAFAALHNLIVTSASPLRRTITLAGATGDIAQAFDIDFHAIEHQHGDYITPSRPPSLPHHIADIVETVLGLHSRPAYRRHRRLTAAKPGDLHSIPALAEKYQFPPNTDGHGQVIALIELGGGFHLSDIEQYCASLGLPTPHISIVDVDGTTNQPASPHQIHRLLQAVDGDAALTPEELDSPVMESAQATVETTMDIEIVAALAPAARIVVYFAPPDEQGIHNAILRAIHDTGHRPSIISISWGEPEVTVTDAYAHAVDRAFLAAAQLGITVCASSGDSGALNHSPDHLPTVNFPASSPHCLACGGATSRFLEANLLEEVVWNSTHNGIKGATGGGVSRKFPLPPWQASADVPLGPTGQPGRGVPDVAGPADPRFGAEILVAGRTCSSAGTSAVAPMWAALIARCNQALNARCGHLHHFLYNLDHATRPALRNITTGHNDFYHARPGWDACTGHGTPHGEHLLHHLQQHHTRHRTP